MALQSLNALPSQMASLGGMAHHVTPSPAMSLPSDVDVVGPQPRRPPSKRESFLLLVTDISVIIIISNASNKNNNTNVDEDSLLEAEQMKQKPKLDLTRFQDSEPDYIGILGEVIPPTKQLYAISPHRQHDSDSKIEFSNLDYILFPW